MNGTDRPGRDFHESVARWGTGLEEAWQLGAHPELGPRRRRVTTAAQLGADYLAELTAILDELTRHDPPAEDLVEWPALARLVRADPQEAS
ncbi:hypothetical protein ACIQWA_09665 [Kitasatospora sp. NPDC098652]|uniref:hypothetical protein n=1 Tax=Kitasatospora sp. NPDC098652 TaxID=3364095 RepID=UPI0038211A50